MSIPNVKDCALSDAFPIAVDRYDPQDRVDPAARDFSEIAIIVGGHALRVSEGDSWLVTAGDVFVVGRHEGLAYRETRDLRLINVLFRPERLHIELLDLSNSQGIAPSSLLSPQSVEGTYHKREFSGCLRRS